MTAIRSSRLLWALIPVLAVLATLALMRSERPSDQRVELPFDFRQTADTSTDTLISSLQAKIRENPKDFESHIRLANAYLQKVRETGDPTLYTKTEDLLDEARKLEDQSPESVAAPAAGLALLLWTDQRRRVGSPSRTVEPGLAALLGTGTLAALRIGGAAL